METTLLISSWNIIRDYNFLVAFKVDGSENYLALKFLSHLIWEKQTNS